MATHAQFSKIESLRRPSGGLGGEYNGVELDWEPGDYLEYDPRLQPIWLALKMHVAKHRSQS